MITTGVNARTAPEKVTGVPETVACVNCAAACAPFGPREMVEVSRVETERRVIERTFRCPGCGYVEHYHE